MLRRPIHSANERTKLSRILTSSRGVALLCHARRSNRYNSNNSRRVFESLPCGLVVGKSLRCMAIIVGNFLRPDNGRLVGFGPGVPFKSSDFNDLPQTRPARRHHRYIAAFVFATSRTSDERTRSCHRHAGKDVYSGVRWILSAMGFVANYESQSSVGTICAAKARTRVSNSAVTESGPSGSIPGIRNIGRNSWTAELWLHHIA